MNDYQRIDQWLWHVRIFKTRLLSSKSIMSGNIEIDQSKILHNQLYIEINKDDLIPLPDTSATPNPYLPSPSSEKL